MTCPETGRGPLKQCSALGVIQSRSANLHATAIPHTANVVQRELCHRADKAGGDRGAHACGRRALKGLCHQEQPRPRACVVAPARCGHGPVWSTVRRGPPLPVANCEPSPGRCVFRALWLRGRETWGEGRARRVGWRRRQARGDGARVVGWRAPLAAADWWGCSGGRVGRVRLRGWPGVGGWVWGSAVVGGAATVGLEVGL